MVWCSWHLQTGNITFGNVKIQDLNLFSLRSCIGYIPQDGYLFSGTVKENIAFASNTLNEDEVIDAANKSEILDEIDSFTDRFETIIGERGVQLSGGQRQRLAIARTFYKKPNLFIFDDCLSAIDATKEQQILKNLKKESKGKTSIIISHRVATLKEADKIVVLEKGEIIEEGTHQELLAKKGFYFDISQSQNKSIWWLNIVLFSNY